MKLDWKRIWLVCGAAVVLLGTGCSGINASKSFSPLDFLLPGIGGFRGEVQPPPPAADPSNPSLLPQETIQSVAQAN